MKVLIIESSVPKDFYNDQLDGPLTLQLLKIFGDTATLRYVLNEGHFEKAIKEAAKGAYDMIHISCHGSPKGISLADRSRITWRRLVSLFEWENYAPKALVMSSCCGNSSGIGEAFEDGTKRPEIIFGSTDVRTYDEYTVAWAILYRTFYYGITAERARVALAHINAVVNSAFKYRRWIKTEKQYRLYPDTTRRFGVVDVRKVVSKEEEEDEELEVITAEE
jgi:hypothetical protein